MDDEIELVSDGGGLSVIGNRSVVERFLDHPRYSRAREGVALRAGAALNDALKRASGTPPRTTSSRTSAGLNGTVSP